MNRSTYVTAPIKITTRNTRNQLILGCRRRIFHFEPRKYIQSSYHLTQMGVNPSLKPLTGLSQSRWLCESLGLTPAAPPEYGGRRGGKNNFGVWLVGYADQPHPKPHSVQLIW